MFRFKYFIILSFVLFASINILAQGISGKVVDAKGEPLVGATIYIDGTTIGDVSDVNGRFNFQLKSEINAILIVSFVGYQTIYLEDPSREKPYLFQMKEDVSVMSEVIVYNNPFSRKQLMKAFKTQFIGSRRLQRKCKIINEDEIRFRYNPVTLTFSAYADLPLDIQNDYLGYSIQYNLAKFEVQYSNFSLDNDFVRNSTFSGTTQFRSKSESEKHEKRRKEAFQNSSLSFFRTLKADQLEKNGYQLYHKGVKVALQELMSLSKVGVISEVIVKKQERKFNPKDFIARVDILYNGTERSAISFYTKTFIIDAYGLYSHFDQILFSGAIAQKKMGLILPADYGL